MEHRHFTLNVKKQYTFDRYELEKKYIISSNGDDAVHYELDQDNMERLVEIMKEQYEMEYPLDNFVEYFKTNSMADFAEFAEDWSIKLKEL